MFHERVCFFHGAIDQNKTLTILDSALPCYGSPGSAASAENHHPEIAQIDGKFAADCSQKSFAVRVEANQPVIVLCCVDLDCIDGTAASGALVQFVNLPGRRNLVRYSYINSNEIKPAQKR